jgi:Tfp pilus assembly protein PilO
MKPRLSGLHKAPTWAVTLGIAMVAVAYVLFVFLPFQKRIAGLSRQLRDKRLHVVQADQLILPLARERERLGEIRQHMGRWEQNAPDPHELAAFYARISEQARQTDVRLVKFEPQTPRNLQTLRQYAIALSIEGNFEQLFGFLTRVEQLPQTISPSHLRVSRPEGGGASLQCEMTLTFFGDLVGSAD